MLQKKDNAASTQSTMADQAVAYFEQRYGAQPRQVVCAPGRVNLIGEHTDYNDGFVLPMAIDREVFLAIRPRGDAQVRVYAVDFEQQASFSLNQFEKEPGHWLDYVKGVAWTLLQAGHNLQGWDGVLLGNVPIGSGLSSSAALELAVLRAFAASSNIEWEPVSMAKLGRQAENNWVGVRSGIMDQLISATGREGHAVLLDCRSLTAKWAPMPRSADVVVLDTTVRRGLVASAYNERQQQCAQAAQRLGLPSLRDIGLAQFEAKAKALDEVIRRRARHVVSENERTLQAFTSLKNGELTQVGKLMDESHQSLRDDFQVSNEVLNLMVQCAQQQPGCYGARMTGAGFGGCAVALVDRPQTQTFVERVARCYLTGCGLTPGIYVCTASQGARIVREFDAP